ncbi:MAG: aminotransferase class I/II-fold pyridoxal phosphate-dependent enzyme [Defluviitaleaceae bacterium]|nr:aminotransferase class I/II-fold pyridoxal phosphate-dependent enzyme [Defluviitaleaceae bacterium]
MEINQLTKEELQNLYNSVKEQYDRYKARGLKLDMSRGKPGSDQLDLSMGLMDALSPADYLAEDGTDCRNYGGLDGIPEMKKLFTELMDVNFDEVLVGGNSSLSLMYGAVSAFSMTEGRKRKFLCPSPGYDRHFAICEYFDIEMITIPMNPCGPDMAEVQKYMSDPDVAGMWCVPVFSNPQGIVYSDEVIKQMATLKPAAADFRIFWDNAYFVHSFEGEPPEIVNLLQECEKNNNYDMPLIFTSFSKISFAGGAVSALAASPDNLTKMRTYLSLQTIGPDKLNQLRHVRYFKDKNGVLNHMKKHGDILRPKFNLISQELSSKLKKKGLGTWINPKGGYFISFDTLPGCAKRTVALCAEAGLVVTPAGAAYPYGQDPLDSNIRLAPSYPSIDQLKQAMELFCIAVELAALEKLLN